MENKPTQAQNRAVGELLRTQRRSKGLTQEQVAQQAGVALDSYGRFELGERSLITARYNTTSAILRALDINMKWFIAEYLDSEKNYNVPPKPLPETHCKNCGTALPCSKAKNSRKFCCGRCRGAWWARHQYAVRKIAGQGGGPHEQR